MQTGILVLHILICVILIVLVLLQSGRDGMGVIFGGGGNSSVFGSQGAGGILSKLTAFLAALFIVTSLGYNIMFSSKSDSVSSVLDVQFEEIPTNPVVTPVPAVVEKTEPEAVITPDAVQSQSATPAAVEKNEAEVAKTSNNEAEIAKSANNDK